MKGTEFVKQMMTVAEPQRSAQALAQILAGHYPDFMASPDIRVDSEAVIDGLLYRCSYRVFRNYLGVGEQPEDFVTWPLSIVDLQNYCDAKNRQFYIPPAKLIYNNWFYSTCKILPQAIWPGHPVGSATAAIGDEQSAINAAMTAQGCPLTSFIRAKKAYNTAPNVDRAAYGGKGALHFTGWYYPGGSGLVLGPMPSYSLRLRTGLSGGKFGSDVQGHDSVGSSKTEPQGHPSDYADYSHGCDVIHYSTTVNDEPMDFADVCAHPKLWVLVSDQGPFIPRYPSKGLPLLPKDAPMPKGFAPSADFKGPVYRTDAALQSGMALVSPGTRPKPQETATAPVETESRSTFFLGTAAAILGGILLSKMLKPSHPLE